MRFRHGLVACLATVGVAHAQPGAKRPQDPYATAPQDPYGPAPAPAPDPEARSSEDAALAERVAAALVQRAQQLADARVFLDAKQLAVEALVKSPTGAAAEQARALIKTINQQLGIAAPEPPTEPVDLTPIEDPTTHRGPPVEPEPERPERARRLTSGVHSALYVGLIGTTIGSWFSDNEPAGAIPVGIASGVAAGIVLPRLIDKLKWNEAQVRTAGAGTIWGGVVGGLFGDIAKKTGTTAREVLVGASIGATVGGIGGALLARDNRYTPGDLALVDTFAGIGAVGGLTLGMVMQPAEGEAYSLNSALGAAGGVIVGLIAGPQTNTTPRRMARVAGLSAIGGAAPFLLYAAIYDRNADSDERLVGALSTVGLVAGAYIGFRLTREMDVGQDVMTKKAADHDAPPSVIGRSSSGRWSLGAPTVQPLSRMLAPQRGMTIPLVAARW